jgi:formyl-CoA transferase
VIKIEPPGAGDPLRNWRLLKDGTSVWWQVQSRNKRSVALDLRQTRRAGHRAPADCRGRCADRELPPRHAGRLGLSPDELLRSTPACHAAHLSGYGQTGPYRDCPALAPWPRPWAACAT